MGKNHTRTDHSCRGGGWTFTPKMDPLGPGLLEEGEMPETAEMPEGQE